LSPVGPYTFFDVLRAVLRKVFAPLEKVKVGLMLNHDNSTDCTGYQATACSNGGQIAMDFQLFDATDSNGAKARFHAILDTIPTPAGDMSHSYQGKELFFEFFRYLTGQGVFNAHNGWTDYSTDDTNNLDVDHPGASWDTTIEVPTAGDPDYASPFGGASECTKVYTVNPLFFVANQGDDSDSALRADIGAGGLGASFGGKKKKFEHIIEYLNNADLADGVYGTAPDLDGVQSVTSYFIVDPNFINKTTIEYAQAGGTGLPLPLSGDPGQLVATLTEIFRQILSVSTTFVAASVPVNVFNRAQVNDSVYLALFRIDAKGRPFWPGNVKKLRLVIPDDPSLPGFLVDANGNPAVAPDGRIRFDALTYWTDSAALLPADPTNNEVDGADGRVVTRGGSGQQMPGYMSGSPRLLNGLGGRTVYYDAKPNALAPFDVDLGTATALQPEFAALDVNETAILMAHARGLDMDDEDTDGIRDEPRAWIMGDPLHSRPLAMNFGATSGYSETNPAIYLAVGTNDGMLHMIRNTNPGGGQSGAEVWAFMPKSTMSNQKALRANAPGISHPYAIDGPPVAYFDDRNFNGTIEAGERVILYVSMRRGGKAYYALDVTDPESPKLLWTIDKSGPFAELGLTFSVPRIGKVRTAFGARPALIFGGGYDINKDDRTTVGTNDTEGNAIFVVDAETGALIWKARGAGGGSSSTVFEHARLVDSIPSTVSIADTDGDTFTDRIVVGDTGGNVWRADLAGAGPADWKLTLLASLGRHAAGASGKWDDQRFFHRPDLVPTKDGKGPFDAVLIGSGDRPDPLDIGGTVSNSFYMIKDRNVIPGGGVDIGIEPVDLGDVTSNCLQTTAGGCVVDLTYGWQLRMQDIGEKVLATPLTIDGQVFFTSYLPNDGKSATACAPTEGGGRLWTVGLQDARSVINYNTADDSKQNTTGEPETAADRYLELNSPGIPAEVVSIPPNKILRPDLTIDNVDVTTRWRTFWYVDEESDQ
jgi:type IV pilus assembly protein PilY1